MAEQPQHSTEPVREVSRRRVIDTLRRHGAISRAEIARITGLSRSTVSTVVAEMQAAGRVVELDEARTGTEPRAGRPAVPVALDPTAGAALGIDVGHRRLRVAVSDLGHSILAEDSVELDVNGPAGHVLDTAADLARAVVAQASVGLDRVVGVAMCLPGPIDYASGAIGAPFLLPTFVGVRIAEEMTGRLGLPVQVDNDANLSALAEAVWGAGRGYAHLAYIKLGVGIGAGLIVEGRLYRGAGGTAGEIGHTTLDEAGPVCRCGNRGCLEMLAGSSAILGLLRLQHGPALEMRDVLDLAVAGDPGARRVISDSGRHIGVALANLCNLFNPERVVIGGELSAVGELLLEPMRDSVRRCSIQAAAARAEIVAGTLGERAEVLGALALVLRDTDRFVAPLAQLPTAPR
jgi:predicted NBD/HSP70 family sugar kinase